MRPSLELSAPELSLLVEVWKSCDPDWLGPDYNEFCSRHSDQMDVVDSIMHKQVLGHRETKVEVTVMGFLCLPDAERQPALDVYDRLLKVLREHQKATPNAPIRVRDLEKSTGISSSEFVRSFCALGKLGLSYRGAANLKQDPGVWELWVTPQVFRLKHASDLAEGMISGAEQRTAQFVKLSKPVSEIPPAKRGAGGAAAEVVPAAALPASPGADPYEWDLFICHASEDKPSIADDLARELRNRSFRVWYDDFVFTIGDHLRRKIDEGLAKSRFGVVIISKAFFEKNWPQTELDGLAQRESRGGKVILPVWHGVTHDEVKGYSLTLSDRIAARTEQGLAHVVGEIVKAALTDQATRKAVSGGKAPSLAAPEVEIEVSACPVEGISHKDRFWLNVTLHRNRPPGLSGVRLQVVWPQFVDRYHLERVRIQGSARPEHAGRDIWEPVGNLRISPGEHKLVLGQGGEAIFQYTFDSPTKQKATGSEGSFQLRVLSDDFMPIERTVEFRSLHKG
ncbi:MAG: toll/interleukin-1 receptor domain-containing protein [Planctomycetes bacterium]|nr:toll/interleukin-1 receptor domain-containing protein [Planctomycetota bacterium]